MGSEAILLVPQGMVVAERLAPPGEPEVGVDGLRLPKCLAGILEFKAVKRLHAGEERGLGLGRAGVGKVDAAQFAVRAPGDWPAVSARMAVPNRPDAAPMQTTDRKVRKRRTLAAVMASLLGLSGSARPESTDPIGMVVPGRFRRQAGPAVECCGAGWRALVSGSIPLSGAHRPPTVRRSGADGALSYPGRRDGAHRTLQPEHAAFGILIGSPAWRRADRRDVTGDALHFASRLAPASSRPA